jgi:xanthine dehydrogenase YagS FAD-binding subunit
MTMNRFEHANATSLEEAVEVFDAACRPLAGGTDLVAMMKEGLAAPERLVNIKTIPGLDHVADQDDGLHVGALITLSSLAEALTGREGLTSLQQAAAEAASPQLRHMATLGGNLVQRPRCWYFRNRNVPCWRKGGKRCFAYKGENAYHTLFGPGPCYAVHPSDPAVALMALDALVLLVGPRDRRTLPLSKFYRSPRPDVAMGDGYHPVTVLEENEVIAEVIVPAPKPAAASTYVKVMERGAWDFALVSAAVVLVREGETVKTARVVLGGVATTPWRAEEVETVLTGSAITDEIIDEAAEAAVTDARPLDHNGYKVDLVKGAVRQALRNLR